MIQLIFTIIILSVSVAYAIYLIYRALTRKNNPCAGCAGCALSKEMRRKKEKNWNKEQKPTCYNKKQDKKFGY